MESAFHIGSKTADDLAEWAEARGVSAEGARSLGKRLVGGFAGRCVVRHDPGIRFDLPVAAVTRASDGTVRFAIRYPDGAVVEAVAIPHPGRMTVCLSSQVGCARACVFCETGRIGLMRQLAAEEITGQFAVVSRSLAAMGERAPTNIVFMGMGEPLDNLDAVLTACAVLSDDCGFAVAPRRITVSTVGIVPKMREFYRRAREPLAVSLHAANDADRQALVPAARVWNLDALRAALAESPRTVLLQWTLIDGINDSERHCDELRAFCEGLDVRVNLIPLNPGPADSMRAPPLDRIRRFQRRLRDAGVRTLVRMPHGQEIGGACGQLAGAMRQPTTSTGSV